MNNEAKAEPWTTFLSNVFGGHVIGLPAPKEFTIN
jgi:hypothetical protein